MRNKIYFYCSKCNSQNYYASKNKTKNQEKLKLNKFCNHCRQVSSHKEKNK